MKQKLFLVWVAIVWLAASAPAQRTQQVTAVQYFYDNDPGVGVTGNGDIVSVTSTANLSQTFSFTVPNTLSNGFHNLYVRARDENGRWSLTERRLFIIQTVTGTENITHYQYYFDTDPGVGEAGNGAIVAVTPTANYSATVAITVPNTLTNGFHNLYVRTRDVSGQWSLTERRLFIIQTVTGTENITAYQYFFDTDPGVGVSGNGALVAVTPTANYSATVAITVPNTLTNGFHNLYVRTRDESGEWSLTERRLFIIQTVTGTEDITDYQYYFDTDPGVGIAGNGAIVPVTPTANFTSTVAITVPNTLSNGFHNLYVRTRDVSGQWSLTERRLFIIQTVTGTENITHYQYFFDTDPGVGVAGNGAVVAVTPTANFTSTVAITVPNTLSGGFHNLYVRTQDVSGQWSLTERRLFIIQNVTTTENVVALEYYFDNDPGVGNGNPYPITPSANFNTTIALGVPCLGTGNHYLYVRAKDVSGQWSIIERDTLNITSGIAAAVVSPSGPISICSTDSVTLSFTPAAGVTYQWLLNGTDISGETGSSYVVHGAGNYSVKSTCGSSFTTSNVVVVNTLTLITYYADADNDGYGNISVTTQACVQPSGYVTNSTDCNDGNNSIHPGAAEVCNGIDDDCDLSVDEGVQTTFYADTDNDGYGNPSVTQLACTAPSGYVANDSDCNDGNMNINPGATEVCNGIDDNCAGGIDEGVQTTFYADADNDGFGNPSSTTLACTQPSGYVSNDDDCNDANMNVNPNATETCNSIDDDCDGLIDGADPSVTGLLTWYADADNDGYGISSSTLLACSQPAGYVSNDDDCNDGSNAVNPGITETCNGIDDDCDGLTDDADPSVAGRPTWYADADNDTYGNPSSSVLACYQPAGYVSNNLDCNDGNMNVYPGATEVCNGIDDNCIGGIDEGVTTTFYRDFDTDGYGNPSNTTQACSVPSGYVSDNTDCDDFDTNEHPGQVWYVDADGDDYGTGASVAQCIRPSNSYTAAELTSTTGDCNDAASSIHPNAAEICNGIDEDCDFSIDEGVLITFYADADADGYGNPSSFVMGCSMPSGYITNNLDCDDSDLNQHPGQIWYIDNDGDDYGTGATVTQCLRPSNGYLLSELESTIGDCNDNNPNINPASQTLTFSGTTNFINSLVYPLNGTGYTNFAFEVIYTDATNSLPPPTFPRVILDYEGNGIFNNANDRTVIMSEYDVNDVNTTDGKRYIGTINSLTAGTNWQTRVQVTNGACVTQIGPYNYPDVLILPDLQIFANDITFSAANPPVSSPLTVNAVVHNVSDFAAQNFYVHLVNQYDNTSPADILVSNLAPHASTTVSWNITTPSVPAWCPMQVSIDYTNAIAESNELDNSAMRPFTNGNFNIPGGIVVVNAASSPSVSYTSAGATITISGKGFYYGTPVPLADSSVAGGTISFTVTETNATYTTYTNAHGYFSYQIPAPAAAGTYHITGSLTDYTFTGNFGTQFTMVTPSCLPDLRTNVSVSAHHVVAGNPISGSITVSNNGCQSTTVNTVLDIFQSGGTPTLTDVTVPPLAVNASYTTTFSNLIFATPGTYSICGTADATFLVTESSESNNTDCEVITVIPAMPEIFSGGGPGGAAYICNGAVNLGFTIGNSGGAATGQFNCDIIVRLNNVIIDSIPHAVANINATSNANSPTIYSFSVAYTYPSIGVYTFEVRCDIPLPNGVVTETNESNNTAVYTRTVLDCKPDLVFDGYCEMFDVQPVDPQFPGTVTYVATMMNTGNATAFGPIDVRFHHSGGADYDMQYMGNLTPGQSTVVTVTGASVAPATQTLTAIADPFDYIDEWNETDAISGSLCWDFQPFPKPDWCGDNFWSQSYLVNQSVYLSVGMKAFHLYDASSVKMRFQVSGPGLTGTVTLGDAIVNNVQQTCFCPRSADLSTPFTFPQVGTYTFTMTADPDGDYIECNENNNVLVVTVVVTGVPDMRILSQHINPSMLNPQPGQPISLDVTYENIGISNVSAQMELRVLVDEIPLDSVFPVSGLITGDNATISIPAMWSSNTPGSHIIRAKIDSDNQVTESNEQNNEATRAIVVGETANLYFQVFASSNPIPTLNSSIYINAQIGNNGDVACDADVQFFYLTNTLDTIPIGVLQVSVDSNNSTTIQLPWIVLDPTTTLIGRIINSSVLEYTYDDNQATTVIGAMSLSFTSTQSCNGGNNGTLTANASGGEPPYSYQWNNSFNSQTLTGGAGTYSVTVIDNTGQSVSGSAVITNDPGVTYYADADSDGYGNYSVSQISCIGIPPGYVSNSTDCNDANMNIHPNATELCNSIDDDCDSQVDEGLTLYVYYADTDGDGFGNISSTITTCVTPSPAGYSSDSTDCNDNSISVHALQSFFVDADQDGYGSTTTAMLCATSAPSGYSTNSSDCNDANANVHPGTTENCENNFDDNCNAQINEGCTGCTLSVNAGSDKYTYFGYSGDQQVTRTAIKTGGTAPFTWTWSIGRPLMCNVITNAGDEIFSAGTGGSCSNTICPTSGTLTSIATCSGSPTVTVRLMDTTSVCVTVTDANNCTATDCFTVYAMDVRCFAGNSNNFKVYVCHYTGSSTNPYVEICVANEAVPAHLAHNSQDYVGHCVNARTGFYESLEERFLKCYPNPFTSDADITFRVMADGNATLKIYDLLGKEIKVIFNQSVKAGEIYTVKINGSEFVPGIYHCVMMNEGVIETTKMTLMK
jgi:hypothetical protein